MGEVYSHLSEEERQVIQYRGAQRRQHTRNIGAMLGPQPVQRQPGDQTQHMVPVQRERVVPPVPAEKTEGGAMDRPLLHRRARAAQGRPQEVQATKALPAVARPPVGAGGRMAGPRLVAAAHQRQAARPVAGRCAHARVPGDHLPMGLLQQAASGTLGAVPAAQGTGGGRRHGGRRTSRFPDPRPSPHLRTPAGGRRQERRSAIGRPTASSEWDATCTPRWRGGPGSSWPASFRTRPPARASGRSWTCSRRCRRRARQRHARQRHRVRPPRKAARRAGHGHVLRRPVLQLAAGKQREPQRHDPPVSAQTLRDPGWTWRRRTPGRSSTRSTTAPCACSATARPPRRSPTNC